MGSDEKRAAAIAAFVERAAELAAFDATDPTLLWRGLTARGELVRIYVQLGNVALKVARNASDEGFLKIWEFAGDRYQAEVLARIGAARYIGGLEPEGWIRSVDNTREPFVIRARGTSERR